MDAIYHLPNFYQTLMVQWNDFSEDVSIADSYSFNITNHGRQWGIFRGITHSLYFLGRGAYIAFSMCVRVSLFVVDKN